MADSPRLGSYDDTPIYTIKTVVQQTGIAPATLRAWERRYGVLSPGRSDGGYRLYSERDIATLHWLKRQVEDGVSISSAITLLDLRRQAGKAPELAAAAMVTSNQPEPAGPALNARSTEAIGADLLAALLAFRESAGEMLLAEAFALYPVEVVAEEIIAAVLVEIGEQWHAGQATVVQEHFATAFLRQRLTALFQVYDQAASGPLALAGAAPGEWHDVGILLAALTLRRNGWRVIYLGQNVPMDHLIAEIGRLQPALVCLSATTTLTVPALSEVVTEVARLPEPRPRLALGGQALNQNPELHERFPDAVWTMTARELAAALARS